MTHVNLKWDYVVRFHELDRPDVMEYLKNNGGVYLQIIDGTPNRVIYVGETNNFLTRHLEHFSNQLSGKYVIFNISKDDDFIEFLKKYKGVGG